MKRPLAIDSFGPAERAAILEVLDSGQFTMGKRVAQFEQAYAAWLGSRYCVAVNSGSSAVLLMVAAWTLRYPKRETGVVDGISQLKNLLRPRTVIVPAIGWATSYAPFQQYGWRMIFIDIDRETLNYDTAALTRAVDAHDPDLILAIHLLGNPNDLDAVMAQGVPVLEDNCEAMGAEYPALWLNMEGVRHPLWKKTGTFGAMAAHSTYFSHHMSTIEGGLVTTDDETFYHMLLALRSHGWTRHLPPSNTLGVEPDLFSFIYPGYNVRPNEIQGALGLVQLKRLDGFLAQRRDNAARFPYLTQKETGRSAWFSMYVPEQPTINIHSWLRLRYETRPVMSGNFLRQPVIHSPRSSAARYNYQVFESTPNADWVHEHGLLIGNSHARINWEA